MATATGAPTRNGDTLSQTKDLISKSIESRLREAEICARDKGLLKSLNEALLVEEYGDDCIPEERSIINFSGSGIEQMESFSLLLLTRLTVCILRDNYIEDITPLDACTNLIKLDVSNNQIACLPPGMFWARFPQLIVLYLHNNNIHKVHEVIHLGHCTKLQILTLNGTPVSLTKGYRHTVVNSVSTLKALDAYVISDEEIVENFPMSGRFAAFSKELRLRRIYQLCPKQATARDEMQALRSLLSEINRKIAKCSPIVILQRCIRGCLTRKQLKAKGICIQRKPCEILSPRSKQTAKLNLEHLRKSDVSSDPFQPSPPRIHIFVNMQASNEKADQQHAREVAVHVKEKTDEKMKKDLQDTIQQSDLVRSKTVKIIQPPKALGHPLTCITAGTDPSDNENDMSSVESDVEEEEGVTEELRGQGIDIQFYNLTASMKLCRKLDRYFMRKATAKIEAVKASQRVVRIPPSQDVLLKDDLDFRRLHGTMNLSTLESVSRAYQTVKQQDLRESKKTLVLNKMKERLDARRKIDEYHEKKKEEISQWKQTHKESLERMRDHCNFEDGLRREVHCGTVNVQRLQEKGRKSEVEFVRDFSAVNSTVSDSLKKEDHKNRCEENLRTKQCSVKEDRENASVSHQMRIQQQEEKAELVQLKSSQARLQLMRDKYKAVLDKQKAVKEKVAKVKESLPPCTSRMTHKGSLKPVKSDTLDGDLVLQSAYDGTMDPHAAFSQNSSNVVNLSMPDSSLGGLTYYGLPAGRIIRHYSFMNMEQNNVVNTEDEYSLPILIETVSLLQRN